MTAQSGLASGTDNTTTWADRTVQEAFALSRVSLKRFFSLIAALEAFNIRRGKTPKFSAAEHWKRFSPLAFSRYASASPILGGRSKHQVYSSSQVSYSLCCKTECWAAVTAADTRVSLVPPKVPEPKGLSEVERPLSCWSITV